ncbi:hypothetical protein CT0861_02222 [Colletotrichum tofieldiae]|uniref:Uncharacterized protein n=1 Tax=Colletotrichum tofieldiae TaxID=708197 RepID=A0A161VTW4_9PEZI|nr:hypothetical protein CT0861_02222 [Colletotrichum tofieldiae]
MAESEPQEPTYSRAEFVSELKSYFEFLTHLYLPPEVVRYPPPGGWEHITPDFVDSFFLGKNDTVADLMRHIPYVRRDKKDDWEPFNIYEKSAQVDFAGEIVPSLPNKYAHQELFEIPEEAYPHELPSHFAPDEEEWRRFATYTFQEFFAMAKDKFRSFRMTAVDRKPVHFTSPNNPLAQIYREEGVFTERYDRERCMSRIEAYFES